jgi:predicted ATP-dependent endonuclease of OLD family
MRNLIEKIRGAKDTQIFIATHSDMISTRLDLRKSILLNGSTQKPLLLKDLPDGTAKFFIKAPDNNILEFVLSKKVILVEGDAEYILMEALYKKATEQKFNESDIHIISVDGTSFKRYLDIAKILGIRTAVIRDNDQNYQDLCVDNYSDYTEDNIKVFADQDNTRYTFEVCFYNDNTDLCNKLFASGRKKLSVLQYMLKNKAEVAFKILDEKAGEIVAPQYIKDAISWISE